MRSKIDEKIRKQIEYVKKRELQHIAKNIKDDQAYKKELKKLYEKTADNIEKELQAAYLRYAEKEGLTMTDAMRKVSTFDTTKFAEKAREYVESKDFSYAANEQLRLYNLKMRTSRLELMKREILLETVKLADAEEAMLQKKLNEEASKELARQAGILGLTKAIRDVVLKSADKIIWSDLHSATFSQRIWANQAVLVHRLSEGLERSILQGYHPREWSGKLRDLVRQEMSDTGKENALFAANRIAVTETARVQTAVAMDSFKRGGYKKYIWIAETDARTCDVCGSLDGEIFDLDGSHPVPPMHPFCRCSIAAYMERE